MASSALQKDAIFKLRQDLHAAIAISKPQPMDAQKNDRKKSRICCYKQKPPPVVKDSMAAAIHRSVPVLGKWLSGDGMPPMAAEDRAACRSVAIKMVSSFDGGFAQRLLSLLYSAARLPP